MFTLLGSFIAAACVVAAALGLQALVQSRMRERLRGLELRPNCLLTRHPIGIVAPRKTLFQFFDVLSMDAPSYLREHGYEVFLIEMPRKGKVDTLLIEALDSMRERCHLIAPSEFESTLTTIAASGHPMIASLTVIKHSHDDRREGRKPSLSDFRPLAMPVETFSIEPARSTAKQDWFESRFLELAISLAERDAMLSD